MSYDMIEISLIESNITTDAVGNESSTFDIFDSQEERLDKLSYNEDFQSRNGSYQERFVYTIENATEIQNSAEEEIKCDRKLSRQQVHFTPTGFLFHHGEYYRPKEYCVQSYVIKIM